MDNGYDLWIWIMQKHESPTQNKNKKNHHLNTVESNSLQFFSVELLWYIPRIILNIQNSKCISWNNEYKQHQTMEYLQRPVTRPKCLVYVSKVNNYIIECFSATKIQVLLSWFGTKTDQIHCDFVNTKLYPGSVFLISIFWHYFFYSVIYGLRNNGAILHITYIIWEPSNVFQSWC